jgi:hypothetical protein|uniref:Uncharacterized protein n=1 Tax=viral metagenome TaxID=1070528 RepID=A0A6C0HUJ0_9ZZZZ
MIIFYFLIIIIFIMLLMPQDNQESFIVSKFKNMMSKSEYLSKYLILN